MKSLKLIAAISLLFTFSFVHSQTIHIKGIVTTELQTKEGKITVYLPDDMRPGDVISGTVVAESYGKNEKEKNKNQQQLEKFKVDVAGTIVSFSEGLKQKINISSLSSDPSIILLDEKNVTFSRSNILRTVVMNDFSPQIFSLPTHALAGSSFRIIGPFDGNASNTQCLLDGKELEILAESPRQTICNMPQTNSGPHTITVEENGKTIQQNVSCVNMEMSVDKLNLRRGENTTVRITVTGLQGLPDNATLTVVNRSPSVINMTGGNTQVITINPGLVNNTGVFNQNFSVNSTTTGNFSVSGDLNLPDPEKVVPASPLSWCACNTGTGIIITRRKYCDVLQNSIDQKLNENKPITAIPNLNQPTGRLILATPKDDLHLEMVWNGSSAFEQVAFTYQNITKDSKKDTAVSFDLDITASDGFQTSRPIAQLDQGAYLITAVGYYGNNQQVTQSRIIIVPAKTQTPSVTNREIDSLKRDEKRYRDSINNINRRIENTQGRIDRNNDRIEYLDSILQEEYTQVNELAQIDATIESIPGTYSEDLKILIDSLKNFKAKIGNLSPAQLQQALDDLDDKINDLEDALKSCQDHLAALNQEEQDLADEKAQIEKDQQQAFRDIMQQLRDAGYDYAGFTGRDRNTGEFKYGYGVVLRGSGGEAKYYKGAVPAQAASAISALNKKINALNQRHKEISDRQKQIPKEKEDTQKECDRLADELKKAKEAREKAEKDLAENNAVKAELDNIYDQIAELLGPLAEWCEENSGNYSLQQKVEALLDALSKNPEDYENILKQLEDLILEKKRVENQHKSKIERIEKEINDLTNENKNLEDAIENDQNKGEGYGAGLGNTLGAIDQAITNEQAARAAAEAAAIAERKRVCLEFMTMVSGSESETSKLALLAAINEQIAKIGGILSDGLGLASELTTDKTKEKIDKVKEALDKTLGPLQKIDELREQIQEILDIKEKLETLLSSDDTPEARAKKFGALMGLMSKVLNKISEEFPILKFFTSYFSYLVEGYNAAVDGVYNIFHNRYKEIVESAMSKISCETLMNEYMKNKSLEDVYRKAYKLCGGGIYADYRSSENRRIFQEEVNKAALKKLIECCIKWSS